MQAATIFFPVLTASLVEAKLPVLTASLEVCSTSLNILNNVIININDRNIQ